MFDLLIIILLIVVGIAILVKGADFLVDGAADVARWLKVSPILVGLTIVALGTSLPEFIVSFFSALSGSADISIGNIIGSNIANIALVIGICAIIMPLKVRSKTLINEFPFLVASSFLLLILANDHFIFAADSFSLGRIDGGIFMVILVLFLFYVYYSMQSSNGPKAEVKKEFRSEFQHENSVKKNVTLIVVGMLGLVLGGKLFIIYATKLAQIVGLSETFIGLTIAALGTSLPELASSGVAAWKGQGNIAVGNIVGSNIFNVLFVLGITSFVKPIAVDPSVLAVDGTIMIFLTLLFLFFATTGKSVNRNEGIILVALYIFYIGFLIMGL